MTCNIRVLDRHNNFFMHGVQAERYVRLYASGGEVHGTANVARPCPSNVQLRTV
jgi:hypothetical protein